MEKKMKTVVVSGVQGSGLGYATPNLNIAQKAIVYSTYLWASGMDCPVAHNFGPRGFPGRFSVK